MYSMTTNDRLLRSPADSRWKFAKIRAKQEAIEHLDMSISDGIDQGKSCRDRGMAMKTMTKVRKIGVCRNANILAHNQSRVESSKHCLQSPLLVVFGPRHLSNWHAGESI